MKHALGILALWSPQVGAPPLIRLAGTGLALVAVVGGYLYPVFS